MLWERANSHDLETHFRFPQIHTYLRDLETHFWLLQIHMYVQDLEAHF